MNLAPVLERELRSAARQPFTYTVRLLAVGALLGVVLTFGLANLGPSLGSKMFAFLHATLFVAIWILVPAMTADSISRERREGTLPLLALTALSFQDVAWAKMLAQGLRAFTLWLAVLPVMALPVMAGGVSGAELALSAITTCASILLAMAAGLLGSSLGKAFSQALAITALLVGAVLALFGFGLGCAVGPLMGRPAVSRDWIELTFTGLALATDYQGFWSYVGSSFGIKQLLGLSTSAFLVGLLCFALLMQLVAINLRRAWKEEPPGPRMARLKEALCRPVFFTKVLKTWMSWNLNRNPVGWLEQRTWSGRLVMWSWLAVVISYYSAVFVGSAWTTRGLGFLQVLLGWLLAFSISVSASGSFRRERETGVLELLLVSPMSESQVIAGRVQGLWAQFLPAILLLGAIWLYTHEVPEWETGYGPMVYFLVMFATLPVVGLYFSLAAPTFIGALLRTLFVSIVVPATAAPLLRMYTGFSDNSGFYWISATFLQLTISWLCFRRLHRRLKLRTFALEKVA